MTTALEGVRSQRHAPAALYTGKDPVTILQEAEWAPRPVWTGAEKFAFTGIRSPDLPSRSQSLYRLRYPARSRLDGGKMQVFYTYIFELNPLNAELNPICHLLALLGDHHILHVSRIRVKLM
jgi:hypothetical protein